MFGKERHVCLELFHLDWEMLPYDFSEQEYPFIGQGACCVKGRRIFFFLNKAKSFKFKIFFKGIFASFLSFFFFFFY